MEEEEDQWQQQRARIARERARGECVARAERDLQAAVSEECTPCSALDLLICTETECLKNIGQRCAIGAKTYHP